MSRVRPSKAYAFAAVFGMSAFGSLSAVAQEKMFPPELCKRVNDFAKELMEANRGKISPALVESFDNFRESQCDRNVMWRRLSEDDAKVFIEFKSRLGLLRVLEALKNADQQPLH